MTNDKQRKQKGSPATVPVDDTLFEAFAVVAGALNTATIEAVLADLDGWTGKEIEAARQALYYRMRGRE
jgi:hypothetical protein